MVELVSLSQRLFGAHGRNVAFTFSSSTCVTEILRDRVDVPSNRNTLNGFRTFFSGKDLSAKKCVSCNSGDMRPMTEQAANQLIQQAVANVAETEGHHPDLHLVGWNNVKIDIWTHSVVAATCSWMIFRNPISAMNAFGCGVTLVGCTFYGYGE
ncbi:pterin-4-alpha-carbinolamine dehydratase 2, mitochondrial-like [Camellia sinensis]|uniref:pterin-4-alpha-carbinolamine dehydratase 2, mitochondrial-like n=1 Tax=Camellia sinensis TaxID=4442 RepID=UPI001036901A|nr:pterin-4-alpha-carbinolamine dehydratase 2, mitochondrial-like [Camellia sinensis]